MLIYKMSLSAKKYTNPLITPLRLELKHMNNRLKILETITLEQEIVAKNEKLGLRKFSHRL